MKEIVSILVGLGALTLMFELNMRHAFNEYGRFVHLIKKVSVSTDTFI